MQPLQNDLRCPAAKDNGITHAAAAPSNLDAAITMRFAEVELQNSKELRATASEIAAPKRISCETSLKKWKWKMWKQSFGARLSSKSEIWRCANEAFVRDFCQNLKVEDVKTKLSCEMSFKFWNFKLCKWSLNWQFHCAADPSMIPVETNVFHTRTSFSIHLPGHALSRKTQHLVHPLTFKNACRARLPSKSESGRCENEAFVRDVLQIPPVEDVIMKLSARLPSKSASGRCENRALARDFPQKMNLESRSCLLFQATFA